MDKKFVYYNGVRFCRGERTGYYLSSQYFNGKRKRLHRYVWECSNGDIPEGHDIHHIDENKYNNSLENLELIMNKEHGRLHGKLLRLNPERLKKARENLINRAVPKAVQWHKSDAGKKWHKEHGKNTWLNRMPISYICGMCGKSFESLKVYGCNENTFCSNNCKSKWRRQQGLDNIEKTCFICDKKYNINKYSRTKTCSPECGRRLKSLNKLKLNQ